MGGEGKSRDGFRRQELGRKGEQIALDYLSSQGFELIERNWQGRSGELDLVVKKGHSIAFVEVRTLEDADFDDPLASITPAKIRQVARAAREYVAANPPPPDMDLRFDVVGVVLSRNSDPKVEHVPDAFEVPADVYV